ncbi:hypothetical protein ACSFA0_25415 [Variovorax sp. LT1P1]|uniref:hypothetical protein n=1 Tax=Variovorax sp. LT1P1 TaxID=3443730 RepID=UPI003F485B50
MLPLSASDLLPPDERLVSFYREMARRSEHALLACAWTAADACEFTELSAILLVLADSEPGRLLSAGKQVFVSGSSSRAVQASDTRSGSFEHAVAQALRPLDAEPLHQRSKLSAPQADVFARAMRVFGEPKQLATFMRSAVLCVSDPQVFAHVAPDVLGGGNELLDLATGAGNTVALSVLLTHVSNDQALAYAHRLLPADMEADPSHGGLLGALHTAICDAPHLAEQGGILDFVNQLEAKAGEAAGMAVRMDLMRRYLHLVNDLAQGAPSVPHLTLLAGRGGLDPSSTRLQGEATRAVELMRLFGEPKLGPSNDVRVRLLLRAIGAHVAPLVDALSPLVKAAPAERDFLYHATYFSRCVDTEAFKSTLQSLMACGVDLDTVVNGKKLVRSSALRHLASQPAHAGTDAMLVALLELGVKHDKPFDVHAFASGTQAKTRWDDVVRGWRARQAAVKALAGPCGESLEVARP